MFTTAQWSVIEAFDDPDNITWTWETLYKDIVNDHISLRRVKYAQTAYHGLILIFSKP